MKRNLTWTLYLTVFIGLCPSTYGDSPPSQIDLSKFPATQLDDVVVPLPSEVFNVLDKLGTPNWRGELRMPSGSSRGARAQIALLLGSVVVRCLPVNVYATLDTCGALGFSVLRRVCRTCPFASYT